MQNAGAGSAAVRRNPATGGATATPAAVDIRRRTINGATKPGVGLRPLAGRVIALSPFTRYGIAIGAALSSILLQSALQPLWGTRYPLIGFYPAIVVSRVAGWLLARHRDDRVVCPRGPVFRAQSGPLHDPRPWRSGRTSRPLKKPA
jgi:hypothetical protein